MCWCYSGVVCGRAFSLLHRSSVLSPMTHVPLVSPHITPSLTSIAAAQQQPRSRCRRALAEYRARWWHEKAARCMRTCCYPIAEFDDCHHYYNIHASTRSAGSLKAVTLDNSSPNLVRNKQNTTFGRVHPSARSPSYIRGSCSFIPQLRGFLYISCVVGEYDGDIAVHCVAVPPPY